MSDGFEERRRGPSAHELEIRITLLEHNLQAQSVKLDEIGRSIKWLVKIVLGAVAAGMMSVVINPQSVGLG